MNALRAAVYNRVSKDRRRTQRSVTDQNKANLEVCERNGWLVGATYTDNDRSASRFATKTREDWQRLLDDLDADSFGILILWEPSRGNRELEMWARLLNVCRRLGVLIHITSHDHTYDVRKPRDWKALAEEGVDAAYDSEETSQRILRTTESVALSGMPHGKLLYGYRREYDRATGGLLRQVIDDRQRVAIASGCVVARSGPLAIEEFNTAAIVRECAKRVVEGQALYEIAQDLNRRGIPTPRHGLNGWQPNQVKDQVINPGYIGRRIHQGRDVGKARWDGILEEDVFNACVAKLTDPSRRNQRDTTIKHLLSGIATCGVCSAPMRVVKNRSALAYSCFRKAPQIGPSFHVSRLQRRLEDWVEEVIVARLTCEDGASIWAADEASDTESRRLEEEAAGERLRLDGFYEQAAEGDLTREGLKKIEQKLLPKIERLEAKAKALHKARLPLIDDLVDSNGAVVRARWENLTMVQKREVLRALTDRIEVLPAGRGRSNYNDWEFTRIVWRGQSAEKAGVDVEQRVDGDA